MLDNFVPSRGRHSEWISQAEAGGGGEEGFAELACAKEPPPTRSSFAHLADV